ncbi:MULTISPECIES: hypothetical protein [unclassified Nocardiopsis]|uniref:hypothetical protein n=1 Tax=Nocardiopsis TaxID=2013 RepID=UPI00387B2E5E
MLWAVTVGPPLAAAALMALATVAYLLVPGLVGTTAIWAAWLIGAGILLFWWYDQVRWWAVVLYLLAVPALLGATHFTVRGLVYEEVAVTAVCTVTDVPAAEMLRSREDFHGLELDCAGTRTATVIDDPEPLAEKGDRIEMAYDPQGRFRPLPPEDAFWILTPALTCLSALGALMLVRIGTVEEDLSA